MGYAAGRFAYNQASSGGVNWGGVPVGIIKNLPVFL